MGRLSGKVAVISGAARGQGRTHAVKLASEGADIVAFDICEKLQYPLTPGATEEDLAQTAKLVEAQDRRCLTAKLDARDLPGLRALADQVMSEFGRVDIVIPQHGIWSVAPTSWETEEGDWQESIDVILSAVWKVTTAFIPKIIEGNRGGAIVVTGSTSSVLAQPSGVAYCVAKHGLMGLMKTLAVELGRYNIRVNAVNPGAIRTPMSREGGTIERSIEYRPELLGTLRSVLPAGSADGWVEPERVSDAVAWLVSDEAGWVTGVPVPVDGGWVSW